jgi:ribosomal protein S18 acetylase RimI-like enzyme
VINIGGKMKTNDLFIKELDGEDDFADLTELSKEFFYEYENNNKEMFGIDFINEIDIKNYFQGFIEKETKKAYIAIIDKKIIGYITFYIKDQPDYWIVKKIGDISGLIVSKNFRKKGIGTKLVMKAIEYFKENGIKYYTVFTSINNTSGISLYKKCGFKELSAILYGEI